LAGPERVFNNSTNFTEVGAGVLRGHDLAGCVRVLGCLRYVDLDALQPTCDREQEAEASLATSLAVSQNILRGSLEQPMQDHSAAGLR